MIFITAKFQVKPEFADRWPEISRVFTEATRAEPGSLWFDWSRSLDDPNEYVLVEAFRDGDAGGAHVNPTTSRPPSASCRRTSSPRRRSSTSWSPRTTGPSSARWPSPPHSYLPTPAAGLLWTASTRAVSARLDQCHGEFPTHPTFDRVGSEVAVVQAACRISDGELNGSGWLHLLAGHVRGEAFERLLDPGGRTRPSFAELPPGCRRGRSGLEAARTGQPECPGRTSSEYRTATCWPRYQAPAPVPSAMSGSGVTHGSRRVGTRTTAASSSAPGDDADDDRERSYGHGPDTRIARRPRIDRQHVQKLSQTARTNGNGC